MASDIEIAQAATPKPITEIAEALNIPDEALEPYGRIKGKVNLDWLLEQPVRENARMILVTAVSPTPAGEGKTTTTVGLGDALKHIGKNVAICLREPSLGPVFGMKGGAAGGGAHQPALHASPRRGAQGGRPSLHTRARCEQDDGVLEIVCVTGVFHLAQTLAGFSNAVRLAQGREVSIEVEGSGVPLQAW